MKETIMNRVLGSGYGTVPPITLISSAHSCDGLDDEKMTDDVFKLSLRIVYLLLQELGFFAQV